MDNRAPLCIFHGNCFDGFTAAWIVKRYWPGWQDADFFSGVYGQPPPDVAKRAVAIVDFSYPRETMLAMKERATSLFVLDHHKTAEEALAGLDFAEFDMNRSGARMAWDHISHIDQTVGRRLPWLVSVVEDRDLWRFKLPETKEAMGLVAATPQTFENWDRLNGLSLQEATQQGAAINLYIGTYGDLAVKQAKWEVVGVDRIPTINVPYMNCSDHVTKLLAEYPGAPFAAGYFRRGDGRWQFSLRSRTGFDVSEVAKAFGGGGHAQAAGFDVEVLPWA